MDVLAIASMLTRLINTTTLRRGTIFILLQNPSGNKPHIDVLLPSNLNYNPSVEALYLDLVEKELDKHNCRQHLGCIVGFRYDPSMEGPHSILEGCREDSVLLLWWGEAILQSRCARISLMHQHNKGRLIDGS